MTNLYVIPARGGSKGIPGKNIKFLNGRPLIYYTLDIAKAVATKDDIICVSTDDETIMKVVEDYGITIPFKRPDHLATDQAGSYEVLIHALQYYEKQNIKIDRVVVLQPTSPFRKAHHVTEALIAFSDDIDMIVSVKITDANPYYVLAEENELGYLEKSKKASFIRRQDCPTVYQYNGAIYVINPKSLIRKSMINFDKVKKYVMDEYSSVDIDTKFDWVFAEFLMDYLK